MNFKGIYAMANRIDHYLLQVLRSTFLAVTSKCAGNVVDCKEVTSSLLGDRRSASAIMRSSEKYLI
jgi:hypothetical protein